MGSCVGPAVMMHFAALSKADRAGSEHALDGCDDFLRLRHAPWSILPARHIPLLRADHATFGLPQDLQIALRRWMHPHAHIHGGRDQYRFVRRQQRRRGEIVGMSACHLGHDVGSCRGDDDEIGRARKLDVSDLGLIRQAEELGEPALAVRLATDRGVMNSAPRSVRMARTSTRALAQSRRMSSRRFIGGDAARDDQQNAFGLAACRGIRDLAIIAFSSSVPNPSAHG